MRPVILTTAYAALSLASAAHADEYSARCEPYVPGLNRSVTAAENAQTEYQLASNAPLDVKNSSRAQQLTWMKNANEKLRAYIDAYKGLNNMLNGMIMVDCIPAGVKETFVAKYKSNNEQIDLLIKDLSEGQETQASIEAE